MINKPKISAISPCFRMKKYIKTFLEELPKQECFDILEIVLDHNEPEEEELSLVKEFQEKYPGKIKHIITNPVWPIGRSMNECIKQSNGDFLTIWNIDDLRTKNSISSQYKTFLDNETVDVVHGNFLITNIFGKKEGRFVNHSKYCFPNQEYYRSMILGPFFMFRKNLVEKIGFFDEQLKSGADYDYAIRLAKASRDIKCSSEILGYYLDEGKGASTNGDGRQPTERTVVELRYNLEDKIDKTYLSRIKNYKINEVCEFGIWRKIVENNSINTI
jgi:GT2 family glycosyltransferase